MDRILLLEGEPATRAALSQALSSEQTFDVYSVGTLKETFAALDRQRFVLVIASAALADGTALDLVHRLRDGSTDVIILASSNQWEEQVKRYPEIATADVLRTPFEPPQLVARVKQRLADRRLSMGPDSAFTVADYLQLAGMARRSVIVHIECGAIEGQIVVQNGVPVWARDREGVGTGAFHRLALLPRAEVNCQPCTSWSAKPNLEGALEQLLLDAARRSDEGRSNLKVEKEFKPSATPQLAAQTPIPPAQPPRAVPRPNPPPLRRERSESSIQKDKPMSAEKPPESQRILTGLPAISAIACADQEGSVLDFAGPFDAETACAVATIASRPITEIVGELGLGDLQSWCVSMGENTWYVVHQARQVFVAQGGASKNPTTVLRKVEAGCRGQQ
jgi:CheY-like chemotaxis protein